MVGLSMRRQRSVVKNEGMFPISFMTGFSETCSISSQTNSPFRILA